MTWTCSSCETVNAANDGRCVVCDMTRAESDRVAATASPPPAVADAAAGELRPASSRVRDPAARRRRWIAWGISALIVAGLALGVTLAHQGSAPVSAGVGSAGGSDGHDQGADGGEAGGGETTPGPPAPAVVIRRHFEHLDAGEYAAAFHLMTLAYRRRVRRWPAKRAQDVPRVRLLDVGPSHVGLDQARVFVRFAGHDTYGDTACRHFGGWVHLVLEDGRWRYDPPGTSYVVHEIPGGCG
jgi:hypothetical protein